MKAQMFILTIVFLVGLIYVVQQNLSGYSEFDFSGPFESNDYYVFRNVRDCFTKTIKTTKECSQAEENLEDLVNFLGRKILYGGFTLDLKYDINCLYWQRAKPEPAPLNVTIRIIGKDSETVGSYAVYHQTSPKIFYAKYWNPDLPENHCSLLPEQSNLIINAKIIDENGDPITADAKILVYDKDHVLVNSETINLFDDGVHYDENANDDVFGNLWDSTGSCPAETCTFDTEVNGCDDYSCSTQPAYCV